MRDLISAMRSRAISASRLVEAQLADEGDGVVDGLVRQVGDVEIAEAHVQRDGIEALPVAGLAFVRVAVQPFVPGGFLAALLLVEAFELRGRCRSSPRTSHAWS